MPSTFHPQAKFDPIPPDLDLSTLVEKTPNFNYVIRISNDQIWELGLTEFEKLVLLHVIVGGKPLVIEGWDKNLPPWLFSRTWLENNVGKKQENVRDIVNAVDMPMTIGHYLKSMDKLTRQWTPTNYRDPKRQRLYLKDIDCPEPWHQHLQSVIPEALFYLNDCIGEKGGPGALHKRNIYNQLVLGKGVGPAGDLMSNLPPEMQAENMMCYIGHEGTYTPAHREMCASLGQNIMVEASTTENGEKAGSSLWFMTESKDREVVSEYFLSMLGHDIEVESHFAQINAWKKAPFPVYIVEQKVGDFLLIPPLAPHQVWNRGTRTMKVAWNRTTVETLEFALHEALPRARMVCRDEQYKIKAIIYYSLLRYYGQLKRIEEAGDASWDGLSIQNADRVKQLKKDFKRLFALYTEALVSEMFSKDLPKEKRVEFLPFDSNVTCSYCRCNIFNRFLTCKTCIGEVEATGEEDTYDICMECYAMGRSCGCISNLTWVEQWQWSILIQRYDEWRAMVIANDGFVDSNSPPSTLDVARTLYGKKPVAQVCQEQLKRRPWRDISNPIEAELPESEPEPEVDDEGRIKKKRSKRKFKGKTIQNTSCHICQHRDWDWKLAPCTTCSSTYCYGTLWRAFDLKPQTVMEDPYWQCPKCLKICSCGKCRRDPSQEPYRPKGTLLGHDTRRVADPRSVEVLVDFSRTNLTWLRDEGDDDPQTSIRMQRLVEKAQTEKARDEALEEDLPIETHGEQQNIDSTIDIAIDPQLRDHESNRINSAEILGINHLVNDLTIALEHAPNGDGQDYSPPEIDHEIVLSGGQAEKQNADASVYTASEATMFVPASSYPDPTPRGRDRMVGVGYYQQANDVDKILFDHPDASTPTEQDLAFTYPRLPEELPTLESSIKKRKAEDMPTPDTDTMDDAHAQHFQVQKKQKLADTRKQGKYFITLNQLEGGQGLIVKLPVTKSKDFLPHPQELDEHQISLVHNLSSPRRSVGRQQGLSDPGSNHIMVGSSEDEVLKSVHREDSDEQEDSVVLATRALQKLTRQQATPETSVEKGIEESGMKRAPSKKSLVELDREESPNNKDPSYGSQVISMLDQKSGTNHLSSISAQKKMEDHLQASPPSSSNVQKSQRSAALESKESGFDPEIPRMRHPDSTATPAQVAIVEDKSAKEPTSAPKDSPIHEENNLINDDCRPVPMATSTTAEISPQADISKTLSKDYLIAKEASFRMVEAGLAGKAARVHSQKANPSLKVHVSPPNVVARNHSESTAPSSRIGTLPKARPVQLMSMAERQALKGKPFKVVAAKCSIHGLGTTPTTASNSKINSARAPASARQNQSNNLTDLMPDDLSSDDDDIPAIRPIPQKCRIEAPAGREGTVKPLTGMLDSVRPGKPAIRIAR